MKKIIFGFLAIVLLASCNNKNSFKISGTIKDAKGEKLYLQHDGLLKSDILDSITLNEDGEFKFKAPRPEYPDFYSLKLNNKSIVFAVDSCEEITIDTQNEGFATDYKVTGSYTSSKIQQLRKSLMNIEVKISELRKTEDQIAKNAKLEEIKKDIDTHKQMAQKLILEDPRSSAAYFALYQQVSGTYIFTPYDKDDRKYCAAVATAYNVFMPEYNRSQNIYGLVMDAIKNERKEAQRQNWNQLMEEAGKGYIDIALPDKNDKTRKLSELEGKVVLIDFSAYSDKESVAYTFALRDLYNKYHGNGFEIYQVSLDNNKLLWEQSIENIPWVCVRDVNGVNTPYIQTFNIQSIPTTFLMSKKGDIIARDLNFSELESAIKKNL